MSKPRELPLYRFRGSVEPSASVKRPVAAYRNAVGQAASGSGAAATTSATVDIFDCIDSYGGWWGISAGEVDAALKQIGDVDTLYVRINSPGGEATEGVAIANLLRAHRATVRVTIYGLAASAASYIATAGDYVGVAPGALMMVHDALNIVYGDPADLRKAADTLDTLSDSIASLYVLKAGGEIADWRAIMHEDRWYSAADAVKAKLADAVGIDPQLPAGLPPVEDEDEDAGDATVIEIDVEISPAARAAARRFDLSMLPNAPAALAPKTPAEPPETPPTDTKEADTMSDTLSKGLRERLGVAEDADEATILAALDEALTEAAEPPKDTAVPAGHVVIDNDALEELRIAARAGQEARAVQLRQDRDNTIQAAIAAGHIAPARRDHWTAKWDADPEGVRASIAELTKGEPIYPVQASGYAGNEPDADPAAGDNYWFPGTPAAAASKEG